MSNLSIDDKLRRLDMKEVTVLYWKCQGFSRELIAERMNYGIAMIAVYSARMYNKLEFDPKLHHTQRKKVLDEQYCPALMSYGKTIDQIVHNLDPFPGETNPEPQVGSSGWEIVIQEQAREEMASEISRAIERYPNARLAEIFHLPIYIEGGGGVRVQNRDTAVKRLIAALLIIIVGFTAWFMGKSINQPPVIVPAVNQVVTQNVTLVATQIVNQVVQAVTAVTVIAPTPIFTETPKPSTTPAVAPLWEWDFANGYPPDGYWLVTAGNAQVVDGKLAGEYVFEIGDTTWKNYSVIIDLGNFSRGIIVGIRQRDFNHRVLLNRDMNAHFWTTVANGQSADVTGSQFNFPDGIKQITVTADGNKFQALGSVQFIDDRFPTGGVEIRNWAGNTIKSIKVIPLP